MEEALQYLSLPFMFLGIYSIMAMSLQLILGGAGLLSLGHAAYFAVGGYASGAFTVFLAPQLGITDPALLLLCGLIFAALMSGLAGFLVALPCLRLAGDYLAIATLGFGEITSNIFKNIEAFGGTRGFKDIPKLSSPLLIWIAVIVVFFFLRRFYKSGLGYAILATRDDEIAARSVGISTRRSKVMAFVIGSALAGIAGAFYAHTVQLISPDASDFTQSVEIVLAVVMGGMFSIWGSLLGAFILVALPEVLRFAPEAIAQNRMMFFALIVIILMVVNPKGLASLTQRFKIKKPSARAV